MVLKIPKIIHQIWAGKNGFGPPDLILKLMGTWQKLHPDWDFQLWNENSMMRFLLENYPEHIETYNSFNYDIQRWDSIRYLILYHFGGLYVDADFECLKPISPLLNNHTCCLGSEPKRHSMHFGLKLYLSNAFMAATPKHNFFRELVDYVPRVKTNSDNKFNVVLETTGPIMLTEFYLTYKRKKEVQIIPTDHFAPFDSQEIRMLMSGRETEKLMKKARKAYSIHYFMGSWIEEE
jgi:inositol phosphorylceramide mannosyltransferase catalytic subunit